MLRVVYCKFVLYRYLGVIQCVGVERSLAIRPFSFSSLFNFKVVLISAGCTSTGTGGVGASQKRLKKKRKRLAGLGWWGYSTVAGR